MASQPSWFNFQALTSLGELAAGYRLYTYAPGTTTHKAAYTDEAGTIPQTYVSDGIGGLYIALDGRGELPSPLWLASGGYDIALKSVSGATVWTRRASGSSDAASGLDEALRDDLASTASGKGAELVGFKQSGSGATERTVGSKEQETISVRDFGAVLDGVADDAAAIQLAFNAANGSGKRVVFDGASCKIASSLSQNNHAHYDVDWQGCQVSFTGGAGTYMLDMTQAGRIRHIGGSFTGSGANHFVKTAGSAAAQATTFPTIPQEDQWSRQLGFSPKLALGFSTVFDFQNFTREVWIEGYVTGNLTAFKATGKVVNVFTRNTVLYSAIASSQAVVVRGDAGDVTFRYAEGLFFTDCIGDTKGTTVDLQDVYGFGWGGQFNQLKTAAGGIAFDVTKGICPITREIGLSCGLMQGKLRIGNGLGSQFLFDFKASLLGFSDTDGTAIDIRDFCKGVLISGATFNNPTGTARMFAVGANCAQIKLDGLSADVGTYTNTPTVDSSSLAGVEAEFTGGFTPGIAFGGSSTGITYSTQNGRYYWRGGQITGYFEVSLTSKGAQVGAATITGLPFQCKLVNGTATVGGFSGMNTAFTPILDITKNTQVINVKNGAAGSSANFTDADFSNATVINGSFSYPVS
jgi:hypothetical protein